jgi:hypothetical protein
MFEQRPRLAGSQAGDVNACYLRTGRETLGRPGERKAEDDGAHQNEHAHDQAPLPEETHASTPTPAVAGKVCYPNRQVDQSIDGGSRIETHFSRLAGRELRYPFP